MTTNGMIMRDRNPIPFPGNSHPSCCMLPIAHTILSLPPMSMKLKQMAFFASNPGYQVPEAYSWCSPSRIPPLSSRPCCQQPGPLS
jgi:hypothetical protein